MHYIEVEKPHLSSKGLSWSLSYGSWIYNYLCNQCLLPLKFELESHSCRGVLDAPLCDKVCQWFPICRWFSTCNPVFPNNKTNSNDITEVLLKMALNIMTLNSNTDSDDLNAGVPKRSVLNPLLFLVFINDIADDMLGHSQLFPNDTSIGVKTP